MKISATSDSSIDPIFLSLFVFDFCFSLFSKYFSESGKLVQKMFAEIRELIDDPNAFVCVLIDEVESLAAAR